MSTAHETPHVCPWWIGYLLASPLRRLWHDPDTLLGPYVQGGMTVLEIGPGMGFFTLPLARMVGPSGRVVCPDVQERMLSRLRRRAERAGLGERVVAVKAAGTSLNVDGYAGRIDLALAIAVVHEVPDQDALFHQIHAAMKPGATLIVAEPTGHVTEEAFEQSLARARRAGFEVGDAVTVKRARARILRKP